MFVPQTRRYKVSAKCNVCGYSESTNLSTGEDNIRVDALRFLQESARRHTQHGVTGNWCVTWDPAPVVGL
jgi:hypothetical protein